VSGSGRQDASPASPGTATGEQQLFTAGHRDSGLTYENPFM